MQMTVSSIILGGGLVRCKDQDFGPICHHTDTAHAECPALLISLPVPCPHLHPHLPRWAPGRIMAVCKLCPGALNSEDSVSPE